MQIDDLRGRRRHRRLTRQLGPSALSSAALMVGAAGFVGLIYAFTATNCLEASLPTSGPPVVVNIRVSEAAILLDERAIIQLDEMTTDANGIPALRLELEKIPMAQVQLGALRETPAKILNAISRTVVSCGHPPPKLLPSERRMPED